MRITVSGTHCSGKSTLIDRFLASHPEYVHEPEPYEWLSGEVEAGDFYRQLEFSAERLSSYDSGAHVIAERNPLDFLAYLLALGDLRRGGDPESFIKPAMDVTKSALNYVDLLVVLPLNDGDDIVAPDEEDLELRARMNERLLSLLEEDDFTSAGRAVVELTGPPSARLAALERAVRASETTRHFDQIARVNELGLWDFTLSRLDEQTVQILGSNDFDYYHVLELELRGVTFCDLPDQFSHAEFELLGEDGELNIRVVAEPQFEIGMREFSIHASDMFVRTGTVYYYNRENLRPGERLAAWVKRPLA